MTTVRYAVVGQGYFGQAAILPAFAGASGSKLAAIISGDDEKLDTLKQRHGVEHALHYREYDAFLASGEVDAVYIALPNNLHCDYTVRAARAGVHVLCEKPMAVTEDECAQMIAACEHANVKLMIAYRLHFEAANLEAMKIATSGRLGDVRAFDSVFSMQVRGDNIRVKSELGGGPLYDIGIYCINAARYIFRAEPLEVFAVADRNEDDDRFAEVPEHIAAHLRFPGGRIATFLTSFGITDVSRYEVLGTRGLLRVDPAYEWQADLAYTLEVDGKVERRVFERRDQVAPEISYFSECIREDRDPEPGGDEGLADVRIIQAINESVESGAAVELLPIEKRVPLTTAQEEHVPPHDTLPLVNANPPTQ